MPTKKKTYEIKSEIGNSLDVRIEKVGTGEKAGILYRLTCGKDRRVAAPDRLMLFKEELEELSEFLKEEFLRR